MSNTITLQFMTRRQNTNQGDDQCRVWAPREETEKLAQAIPQLASAITRDQTWTEPSVAIRWKNGSSTPMTVGAYAGQSGELSFTASTKALLFNFALKRHENGREGEPFEGHCVVADSRLEAIDLELSL